MLEDITYSTGQVSGMTMFPIRTIQEYVKTFRDCFSETARQRSKGRRFTGKDIDILQTIRRLRSDRIQDDQILKVLSGEIEINKLAHQYNDAEVKKMAARSIENYESALRAFEASEQLIKDNRKVLGWMRQENEQLRKVNDDLKQENQSWKERVDKLRDWQLWVMKNFPDLNPSNPQYPSETIQDEQENKRKKILGLF